MPDSATRITYAPATAKAHKLCEAHWAAVDAAKKDQWAYAEAMGAVGFRPAHSGRIGTLIFQKGKPVPEGWAPIPQSWKRKHPVASDQIECRPHPRTATGAARRQDIEREVPRVPPDSFLTGAFGWKRDGEVFGDGTIKWSVAYRLTQPKTSYFLIYPRFKGDKWKVPADLREVRQSEFHKAIEDHNDWVAKAVKRKKAA